MSGSVLLWLRHEARLGERRAPLVPDDARTLVAQGVEVVVEDSAQRAFPAGEYAAAGCRIVPAGSWPEAPAEAYVLGIKELPEDPPALRHRHIYFAHAYKGQSGADVLLRRFVAGGGALLDLEYLTDGSGRRLAAFGYWAGYVGAALAVLAWRGALAVPLVPTTRSALDAELAGILPDGGEPPRAVVIGALGRVGTGARDALAVAGIPATAWDLAETAHLDRPVLLGHDILVNAVLATTAVPPFVRSEDLPDRSRRLRLISDVTCDVTSDLNVLPIYDRVTEWTAPVRRVASDPPLDLIAIDNLPSLLPREASVDFSGQVLPLLADLDGAPWQRAQQRFAAAVAALPGERRPVEG